MTIEELKNYRSICAEIADIKKELAGHYAGDTVQSGSKHPYSVHNVRIEGYKSDDSTVSLLTRLSVLEHSRANIEEFVNFTPCYRTKKAFYLYYIAPINEEEQESRVKGIETFIWDKKPTWEDVADILGNGVTGNALKTETNRYLKKSVTNVTHVTN